MSLIDSSYARIRGDLPTFPGASVPEKLYTGRDQAEKILKKYVPGFAFDIEQAKQVVRDIESWSSRNEEKLDELMQSPGMDLPEAIKLELSSEKAQQFILAGFVVAAYGLGPWGSGQVGQYAGDQELIGDTRVNSSWALQDAQQRLDTFGLIVKMENEGDLEKIFRGQATGAFGVPAVIIWAVVVATVSLAAVICLYLYFNKKLELNNKIMGEMCARAQASGNQEQVKWCLEATERLQQGPAEQVISTVGKVLVVLALGFVVVKYGIPALSDRKSSSSLAVE